MNSLLWISNAEFYPLDDEFKKLFNSFHFRSVVALHSQMAMTGAIISGSAALSILHPGSFSPDDLDFYISPGSYASVLSFMQDHSYTVKADAANCLVYKRDTLLVLKLVHLEFGQEINIVTVLKGHVIRGITQFRSTLVMNYIGWYGIVSYPEWMFAKKGLILRETENTAQCFEKYKQRGFDIMASNTLLADEEVDHWSEEGPECPKTKHHLLDKHCMFLPFKGMDGTLEYIMVFGCRVVIFSN